MASLQDNIRKQLWVLLIAGYGLMTAFVMSLLILGIASIFASEFRFGWWEFTLASVPPVLLCTGGMRTAAIRYFEFDRGRVRRFLQRGLIPILVSVAGSLTVLIVGMTWLAKPAVRFFDCDLPGIQEAVPLLLAFLALGLYIGLPAWVFNYFERHLEWWDAD